MHDTTIEHSEEFPSVGFRARRWQRFERDLGEWLQTPEGRFTAWCAQQLVAADHPAPAGS
jgi:hypothetical protein